jgi:hypothetical protein
MENTWKTSRKGNRWRKAGRLTCTVFKTKTGYTFCIADSDGPSYSDTAWETEREAIVACESEIIRRDVLLEVLL